MQLSQIVFLLPIIGILAGLLMYRFQGRRDIFKLDIVQFYFIFVLGPTAFVWLKTAIYTFLKTSALSNGALFATDTFFSVIFLFFYAFVVMHGLTKTFWLKNHDPLYDLFSDSEYIHLWLSHLLMYVISLVFITVIAIMNLWFPLEWSMTDFTFLIVLLLSFIVGIFLYIFVFTADPKQGNDFRLTRIFKLGLGIAFSTLATVFVIFTPEFSPQFIVFWAFFCMLISATSLAFFTYRSARVSSKFERIFQYFLHHNWGNNISLTDRKYRR